MSKDKGGAAAAGLGAGGVRGGGERASARGCGEPAASAPRRR